MKTAIAIDSLISRDESTFLLELVLNLYPDSEIYTIIHRRGSILGQIETRPIVSSFLSHKIDSPCPLEKNLWILPSAVKGIPIHPSINKIIVISRGLIHGMKLPDHLEKYLYLIDWNLFDKKNLRWQKFFLPYVLDWQKKSLSQYSKIAVSSNSLRENLHLDQAEVLTPTFRTQDFSFVRDEDHDFLFTHHLVYTHDLDQKDLRILLQKLLQRGENVKILGPDVHLEEIKKEFSDVEFVGDHCEATSALYSHKAKVIWDLSQSFFPSRAFGGLASGRPVVVRDSKLTREFLGEGAYFLKNFHIEFIQNLLLEISENYLAHDRKALRRLGLKWNERLFKSKISKFTGKAPA